MQAEGGVLLRFGWIGCFCNRSCSRCCSAAGEGAAGPGNERATAVARDMEQREAAALQRLQQQQPPETAALNAASLGSAEAAAASSASRPAGASAAQAVPAAEAGPGRAPAALDRGGFGSMELHETHVTPAGHGARPPLAGRGMGQQGAVGAGAGAGAGTSNEGRASWQAAGSGAPQQAAGGGLRTSASSEERARLAGSLNRETSLRTFMRSHSPITGAHSPRWMSDAKQQQQWDAAAEAATAAHRGRGSSVQGAEPAAGAAEPDAAAAVGGGGPLGAQGGRQEGTRGLSAVRPAAGPAPMGRSVAMAAAAVSGVSRTAAPAGQDLQRGQASRQNALQAKPEVLSMHGPLGSTLTRSASGGAAHVQQPASQRAAGGAAHVQQPAALRPAAQQQVSVQAAADPVSLRAAPPSAQEPVPAAAGAVPVSPRAAQRLLGTFADASMAPLGSAGSSGHVGEAPPSPQGSGRLASPFLRAAHLLAGAKPASHSRRGSGNLSPMRSPSSPQQALSGNMSPRRAAVQDGPTKEDIARSRLQVRQTESFSLGCRGFRVRHAWAYNSWQHLQDAGCEV